DPLMEQVFQEEVEKIKESGKAILLSSHILSEVERLADKVVIIRQGEIVEAGTLDELRHLTRSTVTIATEGDVTEMASVNGVFHFEQKDNQATFSADNQYLNDILMEASKLGVKKFEAVPRTLEDLFMPHYEGYAVRRMKYDEGKICTLGYTVCTIPKTRLENNDCMGIRTRLVISCFCSRL